MIMSLTTREFWGLVQGIWDLVHFFCYPSLGIWLVYIVCAQSG